MLPGDVNRVLKTATFGATYTACEASLAVAAHTALDVWARYIKEGKLGKEGGTVLDRVLGAWPLTGLAKASFIEAARHGNFAIVTGGARCKPMLEHLASSLGFTPLLRHIEIVQPTGAQLQADPAMAL